MKAHQVDALIVHLFASWRVIQTGVQRRLKRLKKDARSFFAAGIVCEVWAEGNGSQEADIVRLLDRFLREA